MRTGAWLSALLGLAVVLGVTAGVPAGAGTRHVAGPITAVDVDEATLTIRTRAGDEIVVEVPDDALIVLDGEEGAIVDDLFPGDVVEDAEVRVLDSGGLLLVRAVVTSPPEGGGGETPRDPREAPPRGGATPRSRPGPEDLVRPGADSPRPRTT